mgnify:CR=1 FL=1
MQPEPMASAMAQPRMHVAGQEPSQAAVLGQLVIEASMFLSPGDLAMAEIQTGAQEAAAQVVAEADIMEAEAVVTATAAAVAAAPPTSAA